MNIKFLTYKSTFVLVLLRVACICTDNLGQGTISKALSTLQRQCYNIKFLHICTYVSVNVEYSLKHHGPSKLLFNYVIPLQCSFKWKCFQLQISPLVFVCKIQIGKITNGNVSIEMRNASGNDVGGPT